VKDREIDEALEKAGGTARAVDATVLKRVADSIAPTLEPVRPLPPPWVLTAGLVLVCAAVALAAAAWAGFDGFEKLTVLERALIFCALGILAWLSAAGFVGELIPGSRRRLGAPSRLALVGAVLLIVFALLFHDYRTDHFVALGIRCLLTGLVCAVPAALLGGLLLRRGFAVSPVAAGLVGGAFAGLAGVTLLELNCVNFQALHVLVWHTAVVPASAAAGALVGWALRGR
jgi:hypothetical protein